MSAVLDAAVEAARAGLSVMPIRADGSKAPVRKEWTSLQRKPLTEDQIRSAFAADHRYGLAVIAGEISGGVEVLDFDDADFQAFVDTVDAAGLGDVLTRVRVGFEETTPSGGRHLVYRCEEIGGNSKLAEAPGPDPAHPRRDPVVLIETRGEGGYIVAAPSNGSVHETGGAWQLVSGGFSTIATITPDERRELHRIARAFDQMPARRQDPDPLAAFETTTASELIPPGKDFRAKHGTLETFRPIVEEHGWKLIYTKNGVGHFRRPGKIDPGISATFGYEGTDLFKVFSTSTPFETEYAHNPASVYAILNHDGDFPAAVEALRAKGYGTRPPIVTIGGKRADASGGQSKAEQPPEPWPGLAPLPEPEPAPTLPETLLPAPLRPWILDAARLASLPLEMVAAPAVVGLGAIVGRAVGIRPWEFDDYLTVPNLWGAVLARPGYMKSFAVQEGLFPLYRLAAEATDEYMEKRARVAAKLAAIDAAMDDVKRKMRDAAKKDEPFEPLEERFASLVAERERVDAPERRYLTHDATIEKLAELLKENPRGMLVARDELFGLLRSFDKVGRENDRQFYLEGWGGTSSFTSDRIGRGTLHIRSLTLSVIGSIQPGRIRGLVDDAASGGGGDDGLLQRFQILVCPDRMEPWAKPRKWPDSQARETAYEIFKALDRLTPYQIGAAIEREGAIPYLTFSPSAQKVADQWRHELEDRVRSGQLDASPAFASHIGKYRSLMPSLALLFHLVDVVNGTEDPGGVTEHATHLALNWCDFLEAHARRIYDVELGRGKAAARALAAKIEAGAIIDSQTVREIYRNQWSGLRTDEVVIDGLKVLAELGWVRLESVSQGGRASQVVRINPGLIQLEKAA